MMLPVRYAIWRKSGDAASAIFRLPPRRRQDVMVNRRRRRIVE
jgi:hypothetical protein